MFQRKSLSNEIGFELGYAPVPTALPFSRNYIVNGERKPLMTATYVGVLLFYFFYFFRPQDFMPALAVVPFAKITGAFAAVALLGAIFSGRVRPTPELKLLLALFAYLCLCIPGSSWPGGSFDLVANGVLKNFVAVVATMYALTTVGRLRQVMLLQLFAMLTMASLALSRAPIAGRMFGVGNMFIDPNDFALNLCIVLPFCVALLLSSRSLFWKLVWVSAMGVTLLAIVSTYSRGGFLALIATLLMMYRSFRIRARTAIVLLALVGCLAIAVLAVGKSSYFDRMSTITNPGADTSGSAEIRQQLLIRSVQVTLQHPIFGVGPGQFEPASGSWHVTHNSYTQLSAEAGIPALLIFLLLMWRTFRNLRILRNVKERNQLWYLAGALQCAIVGYLTGAFFFVDCLLVGTLPASDICRCTTENLK